MFAGRRQLWWLLKVELKFFISRLIEFRRVNKGIQLSTKGVRPQYSALFKLFIAEALKFPAAEADLTDESL